jgi:GNAT superfamily N-acetyltransferase
MEYEIKPVTSDEDWETFHSIRQRVLWEDRGHSSKEYDRDHPQDRASGNHAFILMFRGEPGGVLRVDVDGSTAWIRRVAVREEFQRRGHGRRMLELVGQFSLEQGCSLVRSFVDAAAIGFYEKIGFDVVRPAGSEGGMLMERVL